MQIAVKNVELRRFGGHRIGYPASIERPGIFCIAAEIAGEKSPKHMKKPHRKFRNRAGGIELQKSF
jgi:hypothetical protein